MWLQPLLTTEWTLFTCWVSVWETIYVEFKKKKKEKEAISAPAEADKVTRPIWEFICSFTIWSLSSDGDKQCKLYTVCLKMSIETDSAGRLISLCHSFMVITSPPCLLHCFVHIKMYWIQFLRATDIETMSPFPVCHMKQAIISFTLRMMCRKVTLVKWLALYF